MRGLKKIITLLVVLTIITISGYAFLKYRSGKENNNRNNNSIALTNPGSDTYADSYANDTKDNMVKFDDREARFADCTEQEILDAVAEHYYIKHGVPDALVRLDSVDGDIWLIQVYEDMGDHVNTYDWYEIDRAIASGITMFGQENVDLASLLNRDPVYIYVEDTPELYDRHGHRADGSSIEYYTASSYDTYDTYYDTYDTVNDSYDQSGSVSVNNSGIYTLSEGKTYAGYGNGQILPGTYEMRVEGDRASYFAYFNIHHVHSSVDSYTLGHGDGGYSMLFNKKLLDFYIGEGDYIEYNISDGSPVITIYFIN